jgi:hypothetical protein
VLVASVTLDEAEVAGLDGVRQVDLITVSGQAGVGGGLDVVPVIA